MTDSIILGGNFDNEQPYYQPPIVTQTALSIGLNKHTLVARSNIQEEQMRKLHAQKRAKQDAYRAMLDHDRVAVIPESRKPVQLPNPKIEATGFMVGRQLLNEPPPEVRKLEQQEQYKKELAEYAARPAIQGERRPFPHRAYTPALTRDQLNGSIYSLGMNSMNSSSNSEGEAGDSGLSELLDS